MAVIYLRSTDGNDADNGSTWALAKATLAAAVTAAGAGGTVYVSHQHAETQASLMTITSPGTAASPQQIICVNDAAEPPTTRATTATVSTTGANQIRFDVTTAGGATYYYGITFQSGDGANAAAMLVGVSTPLSLYFEQCGLTLNNTSSSSVIYLGATGGGVGSLLICRECTFTFGSASQKLVSGSAQRMFLEDCTFAGTLPTTLLTPSYVHTGGRIEFRATDLSGFGAGKTLIGINYHAPVEIFLVNCKLASGVTIVGGTPVGMHGPRVEVVNCDSADTNYRYHLQSYAGTITQETTIVRTGGASDGTTPISFQFSSTANTQVFAPLYGPWIPLWNETIASGVTVTAEVVTDGVTLQDDEAWIEVEHLGTSGFPLGVIESDRIADPIFGTPADQESSSATWTTTGLSSPIKQKLSKQVTPQEKGPIRARVVLAKASTVMYADMKLLS